MSPIVAVETMVDLVSVGLDAKGRDVSALSMFVAARLDDGTTWYHQARFPDRQVVGGVEQLFEDALSKVQALAERVRRSGQINPEHWTRQPRQRRRR